MHRIVTSSILVTGLLKASERAKMVLMEASFMGDTKTAETYGAKLDAYHESAKEMEQSIQECSGTEGTSEGPAVVYIRPEAGGEIVSELTSPWDWENVSGTQGFPVVPPASPFR